MFKLKNGVCRNINSRANNMKKHFNKNNYREFGFGNNLANKSVFIKLIKKYWEHYRE